MMEGEELEPLPCDRPLRELAWVGALVHFAKQMSGAGRSPAIKRTIGGSEDVTLGGRAPLEWARILRNNLPSNTSTRETSTTSSPGNVSIFRRSWSLNVSINVATAASLTSSNLTASKRRAARGMVSRRIVCAKNGCKNCKNLSSILFNVRIVRIRRIDTGPTAALTRAIWSAPKALQDVSSVWADTCRRVISNSIGGV